MINIFPTYNKQNLLFVLFEYDLHEKYSQEIINMLYKVRALGLQLDLNKTDELLKLALELKRANVISIVGDKQQKIIGKEGEIIRVIKARRELAKELLDYNKNDFTYELECKVIIQNDGFDDNNSGETLEDLLEY